MAMLLARTNNPCPKEEYSDAVELSCMVEMNKPHKSCKTETPMEYGYIADKPWHEFQAELRKKGVLTSLGLKQVLPEVLENRTESRVRQFHNINNNKQTRRSSATGYETTSNLHQEQEEPYSKQRRRASTGSMIVSSFMPWRSSEEPTSQYNSSQVMLRRSLE